jgi:hypothetical protein
VIQGAATVPAVRTIGGQENPDRGGAPPRRSSGAAVEDVNGR